MSSFCKPFTLKKALWLCLIGSTALYAEAESDPKPAPSAEAAATQAKNDVKAVKVEDAQHPLTPQPENLTCKQRLYALEQNVEKLNERLSTLEELVSDDISKDLAKTAALVHTAGASAADEKTAYNTALQLLKETDYTKARQAFEVFLQAYPQSSYVPQALYWKGITFFAEASYDDALKAFQLFLRAWPQHPKTLEAQLKIVLCHQNKGEIERACIALEVLKENLKTQGAQLAQKPTEQTDEAQVLQKQQQEVHKKVAQQAKLLERALPCKDKA
ncbi:MAG: tetratricopeptide repeat protein [Holosporaceae bacterium]